MRALLVGYGEIGKGVFEIFKNTCNIKTYDIKEGIKPSGPFDLLLVAIPFDKNFIETVKNYQKEYKPKSTLIFSTTAIGTCSKLGASHCPIEGKHPHLAKSIKMSDKWLGGKDKLAEKFLKNAGFKVKVLDKPEFTEFLKLRSTTVYGLNVEFARYSKKVCDKLGLDFNKTKEWDAWVNGIYKKLGMDWATRYVLDAPCDKKGGHCVTPNAKILQEQYPHELVKIVTEEDLILEPEPATNE